MFLDEVVMRGVLVRVHLLRKSKDASEKGKIDRKRRERTILDQVSLLRLRLIRSPIRRERCAPARATTVKFRYKMFMPSRTHTL